MNITQLCEEINSIALASSTRIRDFQSIRMKAKNLAKRPSKSIFSEKSIKSHDNYAFHAGGRAELQFNIGEDYRQGNTTFRYCLAFSLARDLSVHDPIAVFAPKIKLYNKVVPKYLSILTDSTIWYWDFNNVRHEVNGIYIPDEVTHKARFIAIGKEIDKTVEQISINDARQIAAQFDAWLPIYEEIELKNSNENRIARIVWNTSGWIAPSGRIGKSKEGDSHEALYGWGYEEWLCDVSKPLKGYSYGFLEPIAKEHQAFDGKEFDVSLFAIEGTQKQRYLIGEIKNLVVISQAEANEVLKKYQDQGWWQERKIQLENLGLESKNLDMYSGAQAFNIKFLSEDLHIYPDYMHVDKEDKLWKASRYSFIKKEDDIKLQLPMDGQFEFQSGISDRIGEKTQTTKNYAPQQNQVELLHSIISADLAGYLISKYGKKNVRQEHPTGHGTSVDMVLKENDGLTFYEIKTFNNIRTSIREALGQVMEYAYYPGKIRAKELVIVSHLKVDPDTKSYLESLRARFNLPVFYQQFRMETKELGEKI